MTEPWATLVVLARKDDPLIAEKQYETRDKRCKHRGWLAIQATKELDPIWLEDPFRQVLEAHGITRAEHFHLGCVIGMVEMVYDWLAWPKSTEVSAQELHFGNFASGRYAYEFRRPAKFRKPVPARGMPGLFTWRPWWDESMTNPAGKCCDDCDNFARCCTLLGDLIDTPYCGWAPTRFVQKVAPRSTPPIPAPLEPL
jgi:hypothetical protein